MISREDISLYLQGLQDSICAGLESIDGKAKFAEDTWAHEEGGGGRSRVIQKGNVFEKGGVNFSAVSGKMPRFMAEKVNPLAQEFFATGVSLVIHPQSPHVPIVHMNVRYFEADTGEFWFGGGIDLTPIYVVKEQAVFFHSKMKEACDIFDASYYQKFKDWADEYFTIEHREETRGIGGIFYDYLKPDSTHTKEDLFGFMQEVGNTFLKAYLPIVESNMPLPYSEEEKKWQLIRRGRYVEFNLVYDRGTKFGLETKGRIESILMSLPEHASWVYNHEPLAGSREAESLRYFRSKTNWL